MITWPLLTIPPSSVSHTRHGCSSCSSQAYNKADPEGDATTACPSPHHHQYQYQSCTEACLSVNYLPLLHPHSPALSRLSSRYSEVSLGYCISDICQWEYSFHMMQNLPLNAILADCHIYLSIISISISISIIRFCTSLNNATCTTLKGNLRDFL